MLKYLILIALVQYGLCVGVKSDVKKTVPLVKDVKPVKDVPKVVPKPVVPEVVKDVPQIVKDVPQVVKDVPQVKDVPAVVKDVPQVVKDVPEVVKDVPQVVKDVPQVVKDVPEVVKDVPEVVKDQVVKDVPQVVKDVPEVVKEVPEVVKEVPPVVPEVAKPVVVDSPVVEKNVNENNVTVEEYVEVDRNGPSSFLRDTAYACAVGSDSGYCYTVGYCNQIGGKNLDTNPISSSNCPQFGKICCQVAKSCGDSSDSFVTIFKSKTDMSTTTSCNLQINAADESVCQIRVDFVQFTLSQPTQSPANTPMQCNLDSLTVSGVRYPTPKLCGTLDGQHIYLQINQSEGESSVTLQMNLANRLQTGNSGTDLVSSPSFEIRITQLQCPKTTSQYFGIYKYKCSEPDFNILAPAGCLQYFTARSGTVTSFGYDSTRGTNNKQLSNLNYAICFKKFPNSNCVKFTSSTTTFQMSGSSGNCQDRLACTEMMYSTSGNPALVSNRELCGNMMSQANAVAYCPGENPFVLKVRTDSTYSTQENGFLLNFENPPSGTCPSP